MIGSRSVESLARELGCKNILYPESKSAIFEHTHSLKPLVTFNGKYNAFSSVATNADFPNKRKTFG